MTKKLGEIIIKGENILLIIQRIDMVYGSARFTGMVTAFFYPRSTCYLVLTQFAKKYELEGAPFSITIGTVKGKKQRDTKLYVVELITRWGQRRLLGSFWVENISKEVPYICFEGSH